MAALATCPAWAVIIKGSLDDASTVAGELGLELHHERTTSHNEVCAVTNAPLRVMHEWFNRDVGLRHPLPAGALLHFHEAVQS